MSSARRATPADLPAIAATFGSAFRDDPVFRWMTGLPVTDRRMAGFWRADVGEALRHDDHLVFMTDDAASAAVWRNVGKWKGSASDSLRLLPSSISAFRFRLLACIRLLVAMEKVHPKEEHYYLETLGTRQDMQGKGSGSAVLAPMLERCDTEGVPAYLESSNPKNIAFYVRHGFVERGKVQPPAGAPVMTTMWREPKG